MQQNNIVLPPKTIGIIGGGQLGRMMAIAAKYMGYHVVVLDPAPNCPTAQVADKQITAAYDDLEAVKDLVAVSDVVTYEFENVDVKAVQYIQQQGKLPQGISALQVTQNRQEEKQLMKKLGLPVPTFFIVKDGQECEEALQKISFPAVIKTCRGGYDGKGQLKLMDETDNQVAIDFAEKHHDCILEEWVSFDKEISVIFTRSQSGTIEFFPIAENEHRDHILYKTTVPANISKSVHKQALEAATLLADSMNVVGTFAIEMFVDNQSIYVNEMAPRPHNSGHYTIESCTISQFAQHIRAICGLPLKTVELMKPAVMINILGEDVEPTRKAMTQTLDGFVHFYGKDEVKTKRKMGHITFIGETIEEQIRQFEEAKK